MVPDENGGAPRAPAGSTGTGSPPDLSVLQDPARVAAVERVVARGPAGQRVERLAALAARLLRADTAQISLVGREQQVVAARTDSEPGAPAPDRAGPVVESLCTVTAAAGRPLVVEDATAHPWVRDLAPVAAGEVGAYLGVPLVDDRGLVLGSLCVYDRTARPWTSEDLEHLSALAESLAAELEQQPADAAAQAATVRLQLAVDAADLGSFEHDLSTGRLVWDDRAVALHGLTRESFTGDMSCFDAVVVPDDLPQVRSALASAVETCGDLSLEYRVRLPRGGLRWITARGRVLPDMLGRPARVLGAVYDSSGERELRDELTRLLETMPAAFVRVDRSWSLTYVNALAETLFGRSRSELLSRSLWEAFPEARGTAFEVAYERAMASGERGRLEAHFEPLDAWFDVYVWPDEQGLSVFFHEVNDRKKAHLALESVSERLSLLSSAGARLSASLQPRQVLSVLADLVVAELADWLVLVVVDEVAELLGVRGAGADSTRLHAVQVRHAVPADGDALRSVVASQVLSTAEGSGAGQAVRTGTPVTLPQVPDELMAARAGGPEELALMRRLNTGPVLSVPLRASGRVLGAFTVGGADGRTLDELLLVDLAARAAVALDNALSYARQRRAATLLQDALLPREAPSLPDVLVATRYLPAAADALAGGDFFKTVVVDGRLVMMLGDVMGHGTSSAARAGQLHGLAATLALEGHAPGKLLGRLAAGVHQLMDLQLATIVVCSYDPATRTLVTASAGHPPPLVAPVVGEPAYLEVEPGPPIGVAVGTYPDTVVRLEDGATVVLFSDGLVERRGESIDDGLERLRLALLQLRLPPEAVAEHVLDVCEDDRGWDDDVALLVLNHP